MIGKYQVPIGAKEILSGLASSDYSPDGGISASSSFITPFVTPGTIYPIGNGTDTSTNVSGSILASSEDSQIAAGLNRVWVTDSAKFQSYDGSSVTNRHTGSKTYTFGTTDMVSFGGYTWATSQDNMARWTINGFTLVEDWWTNAAYGNKSSMATSYRHPLLVFEDLLWLANAPNSGYNNGLYTINSSGTITLANWVLQNNGTSGTEYITALGIDPQTGLMLVAVETAQNYSDTLPSRHFVYLYDGYSTKPRRKIPVDDQVTAFYNVGGTVHVGYGRNVGIWNGSGITFLRKLANVTYSGSLLPYKHHFSNFGNVLVVVDGKKLLAYGEVEPGVKSWYPIFQNPVGSNQISSVFNVGSNKIGIGFPTDKFYVFDPATAVAGTCSLYFTNINFPRPVYIRRIRVITTGITTTSGSGIGSCEYFDEDANERIGPGALGTFVNTGATAKYKFDFDFRYPPVMSIQPVVNFASQAFGFVRAIVYYDPAE